MEAREGFTVGEKKTMLLSAETAAGLKLTGITFVYQKVHVWCTCTCFTCASILLYSEIVCRAGTECAIPTRSTTTAQSPDHAGSPRKVFRPTKTARAS